MTARGRPTDERRDDPPRRCSTEECHHRADAHLTVLVGSALDDLRWDPVHQLQGHAHLGDCEIVVIAPRDDAHDTVVFIAEDWDAIRRNVVESRDSLVDQLAIHDHAGLVSALAGHSAVSLR